MEQGVARPDEVTLAPLVPTPHEIRDRLGAFPRLGRGYDPQPVDVYLRMVADGLERVAEQNESLAGRVNELARKVAFHEGRAWAVQEALVTAQTLQAEARDAAEAEGRRIRAEAAKEADELVAAARVEHERALEQVQDAASEATRIRGEAEADVEVLRQEAARELAVLKELAADELRTLRAEAAQEADELREKARLSVKEAEDEALGQLERRSSMLMGQIEERHRALERLEAKRLEVLSRLQNILTRELEAVQSEQARPPVGLSGDVDDLGSGILLTRASGAKAEEAPAAGAGGDGVPASAIPTGIIMPDNTVVVVSSTSKSRTPRGPLTDAPGPLDPGAPDPSDDDRPIAATGAELVVPVEETAPEAEPGEEHRQP